MKKTLLCLCLAVSSAVFAGELENANTAFEKKDYATALKLYTRLANAGNVEAQQHLGEMYWYGEAGEVDDAKAEAWFKKAAAKGNAVAIASLDVMKQRVARRAEIDYWTSKYDGADLRSGEYRCPAPRFPAVSKVNEEIDRVSASLKNWQDCYNRFVNHLNEVAPLAKLIPADVAKLMNKQEMEKATAHLEQVHANVAESARVNSRLVLADFGAWRDATEAWVKQHNEIVSKVPSEARLREIEARRNNYAAPAK